MRAALDAPPRRKGGTSHSARATSWPLSSAENNQTLSQGTLRVFDKMLDEPCPYHQGSVNHVLKECAS